MPQARHQRATDYHWKCNYSGLDASKLKRIRELEAENAKLKRMYAEIVMVNAALKELIDQKQIPVKRSCA